METGDSSEDLTGAAEVDGQDATGRTPPGRKWREMILIGLLGAVLILWAVDQFQHRRLLASAAPLAEAAVQEHTSPDVEVASTLTVARDVPIVGAPVAKVEVFLRNKNAGENAGVAGIEYEYAMENGTWQLKNSGGCTGEQCRIRGKEAFSAH